ncbi:MAG: SPFH domain-containing protein [Deltaproteobacteria bacterium]|nr:MAG: SPFH domain-containing protein [Deltaproteobacteria bacterium]
MSQAIEVIEHLDPTGETIVQRFPPDGSGELKMGAQLVVRENQAAVFFRDGRALDTFGPGRHTVSTLNIPLVTKALSLPFGFNSPFRAEVVFVNLKTFANHKWGTSEPIAFRDAELSMVRLRAFGMYSFRIISPQVFVNTLVGTQGCATTADVSDFFRNLIVTQVADFLGENLESVLDLPQYYNEISGGIKVQVLSDVEKYGVTLSDFKVSAITPPDDVQEMIDKRAGMAAVGNLDSFVKFQAGQALTQATEAGGGSGGGDGGGSGLMGAGIGAGAGFGLATGLSQLVSKSFSRGAADAAAALVPCAKCNAQIPADARFCSACGQARSLGAACPTCHSPVAAGARFCSQCGAGLAAPSCSRCQSENTPGSRFCSNCGNALT